MSTLALQLKSHSSRLEACKAIVHEIQAGNLTNEKREELFQALKEPWVGVFLHRVQVALRWRLLIIIWNLVSVFSVA